MKFIQSPNYDKGRQGNKIQKIVIHWFGVGDLASAVTHFQKKTSKVSAHYLIENNDVVQMVLDEDTAWHAGNYAENQKSIGLEHSAEPNRNASNLTYNTSARLILELSKRHGIPLDTSHIVGHKTIVNTQCPGTINIEKLISLAKSFDTSASDCEKELDGVRDSRDKWKKNSQEQEKLLKIQAAKIGDLTSQLQEKDSACNKLKFAVSNLVTDLKADLDKFTKEEVI
jgi:N-acetylmuramoyl-L-alanine amidase CwlA